MKSRIEFLKSKAQQIGKEQIQQRMYSVPIANEKFRKLLEDNEIIQDRDLDIIQILNEAYNEGQMAEIKENLNNSYKNLTPQLLEKYKDAINYDESENVFSNFATLHEKIEFINKIPEIEEVKSNVKVLVFWSESSDFKDGEVMSIEKFRDTSNKVLSKLREHQKEDGLFGTYIKTKYMFIFENQRNNIQVTNPIRYDIGDYKSFNEYLDKGFSNKNIPDFINKYFEIKGFNSMEKENEIMKKYESVIIVKPTEDENKIKEITNKYESILSDFTNRKVEVESLGTRKLAYQIQGFNEGNYMIFKFYGNNENIIELERQYRIDDDVIKFMTVIEEHYVEDNNEENEEEDYEEM